MSPERKVSRKREVIKTPETGPQPAPKIRRIHDDVLDILKGKSPEAAYDHLVAEVITKRSLHDYRNYAPVRIATYWLQARLGRRTEKEAMNKTLQYLDRLEHKDREIFEAITAKDLRTTATPITEIRHAILPYDPSKRR